MHTDSETKYILYLILAVLLFGSSAVTGALSFLFWAIVIIAILGFIIWAVALGSSQEAEKREKKRIEKELGIQLEKENSNMPKKNWLGFYTKTVKRNRETGEIIEE